jgi:hypothetical protein
VGLRDMSYVMDSFFNYLRDNASKIREKIFSSQSMILDEVGLLARDLWNTLPENRIDLPRRVAAVDGGILRYRLDNGGSLIIVSSYLVGKMIEERSKAFCTFIYPPSRGMGFLLMRALELELAEQAVLTMDRGDLLLLDGSLYGLMSHLPITPINAPIEYGEVLLHFYEHLTNLLLKAEERKITLVSVSKTSSSRLLKEYILERLFEAELKRLRDLSILEPWDLQHLEILPSLIYDGKLMEAMEASQKLRRKYGPYLERIHYIIEEFMKKTPDLFILKNYVKGLGFTRPILLGPSIKLQKIIRKLGEDIEQATLRYFKLSPDRIEDVKEYLEKISSICSVCSFYLRLNAQDYPLKIDVPSYIFGITDRFLNMERLSTIEETSTLGEIVCMLRGMYVNKEIHNIWLYEADRRARISRSISNNIYQIILRTIGQIDLARRQ